MIDRSMRAVDMMVAPTWRAVLLSSGLLGFVAAKAADMHCLLDENVNQAHTWNRFVAAL